MRRSAEALFIPPEEQASVKNLREKKFRRLRRKDHRLIIVEEGLLRVTYRSLPDEQTNEAWLGPASSFNALRLSPDITATIDTTATLFRNELIFHVVVGEESIRAALAYTRIDSFNGGPKFAAEAKAKKKRGAAGKTKITTTVKPHSRKSRRPQVFPTRDSM